MKIFSPSPPLWLENVLEDIENHEKEKKHRVVLSEKTKIHRKGYFYTIFYFKCFNCRKNFTAITKSINNQT